MPGDWRLRLPGRDFGGKRDEEASWEVGLGVELGLAHGERERRLVWAILDQIGTAKFGPVAGSAVLGEGAKVDSRKRWGF